MSASKKYRLALVGTDTLQAQEIKRVLLARRFPVADIEFYDPDVTEEFSKLTEFGEEPKVIHSLSGALLEGNDLVFLAADRETDLRYGRLAAKLDFKAIDLLEAYNDDPDVPLIVAGVNDDILDAKETRVVANPHPATIMLSHILNPVAGRFGIAKAIVFILQPASAFGVPGIDELASQSVSLLSGTPLTTDVFRQQLAFNVLSHTEPPGSDGFSPKERRLVAEVRRVLRRPEFPLSLSVVQASLFHTYAIMSYLELEKDADIPGLQSLFQESPYLRQRASEDPCSVSCVSVTGQDDVFIGQIKKEDAFPRGFWLWSVADNLTRGSALNALDIARRLLRVGEAS
jgi:aspartate-semialdehyde dehydrogenase